MVAVEKRRSVDIDDRRRIGPVGIERLNFGERQRTGVGEHLVDGSIEPVAARIPICGDPSGIRRACVVGR